MKERFNTMRRNLSGLFKRPSILAMVLALALTLLFGGVASAATASSPTPTQSCLTASPLTQTVKAGQPAKVTVTILCYPSQPSSSFLYLVGTWGDGTTSQYLVCGGEIPCQVPPVVIQTSHVYQLAGVSPIYHPMLCLETQPASSSSAPECVSVEVIVV